MKIKSYKGSSLELIYDAIRKELGPEAVVLNPQKTRTLGGLLGSTQYEVIAVVEDAEADTHLLSASKMAALSQFERICMQNDEKLQEMQGLFSEIKRDLKDISGRRPAAPVPAPAAAVAETVSRIPEFAVDWDLRFTGRVKEMVGGRLNSDAKSVLEMKGGVAGMVRVQESFPVGKATGRPHVVVFTGPTGSGKTTTLAKLAARWSLEGGLKVGIITTDTYRVAAVDQIKEYALLLGIELKVVFSAGEATRAMACFKDRDVVLVDTPGRNFHDQMGMSALKGVLTAMGKTTMLLLVPATLERGNITDLIKSYHFLKPDYLVVTKVDETRRFGAFTTLMCDTQCPIAFLTNGQRVPQDIAPARLDDIVEMVMGEKSEVDSRLPVTERHGEARVAPVARKAAPARKRSAPVRKPQGPVEPSRMPVEPCQASVVEERQVPVVAPAAPVEERVSPVADRLPPLVESLPLFEADSGCSRKPPAPDNKGQEGVVETATRRFLRSLIKV